MNIGNLKRRVVGRVQKAAVGVGIAIGVMALLLFAVVLSYATVPAVVAGLSVGGASYILIRGSSALSGEELSRLHQAEVSLANAASTHIAAQELAVHTLELVHARSAVVLIEGIGDTVRVTAGEAKDYPQSVYGTGSRMRLLEDAGQPCGSIAVGARADGDDYSDRDERILDALAQRVSATLQRLAQAEQIATEQRTMSDILASTSDGIFSVGPDLQIRTWNPAMEKITGTPEHAAMGRPSSSVFRPTDEHGVLMAGALDPGRRGEVVSLPLRLTDARATERWVNCTYSPMDDGGVVVVVHDETERIVAQQKEVDFVANIGHELRTPFTPIKGFIKTLLKRNDDFEAEKRLQILQVMDRQAVRLEAAIEDLLAVTAVEDAEGLVVINPTDWVTSVGVVVQQYRSKHPTRDIAFAAQRDISHAMTDDDRARQVLDSLISNAIKFSADGTPVQIQVRQREGFVVTSIIDQGPGIAEGDRERIFEKFMRLGDHMTRAEQGVGLGLYFAKTWAEAMSGSIEVDDAPEGGSIFRLLLPVSASEARVSSRDVDDWAASSAPEDSH